MYYVLWPNKLLTNKGASIQCFLRTLNVIRHKPSQHSPQITDEAGTVIPFAAVEIRDEFAEVFVQKPTLKD